MPLELHVSLYVQALESSQARPVSGVTVQDDVPLHARVLHWSLAQVMEVPPPHTPVALQVSPQVQGLPSSHDLPGNAVTVQEELPLHVRELH